MHMCIVSDLVSRIERVVSYLTWRRMRRESQDLEGVTVAYFKALSMLSARGTEESHDKYQNSRQPG